MPRKPDIATSLRLKQIDKEIKQYSQQCEVITDQILQTLNEADKIPLEARRNQLYQKIKSLEEEQEQLESDNSQTKQPDERKPETAVLPNTRGVPWRLILGVLILIGVVVLAWQFREYFPFPEPTPTVTPTAAIVTPPAATPEPTPTPGPTATPTRQPEPTATPKPAAPQAGDVWKEPKTGMTFVYVPGDCFQMGQTETEKVQLIAEVGEENYKNWFAGELPRHNVCVYKGSGFWIGKYEVTNAQYRQFKAEHDSKDYNGKSFNGDDQPVVYVSWNDAIAFTEWLTKNSGGTATFRLPTEAEWEYAARAGTDKIRYWGDDPKHDNACSYANVGDTVLAKAFPTVVEQWKKDYKWFAHLCDDGYAVTSPVGKFKPNVFGLYDMLGNVWEWCQDSYASYNETPTDGSAYGSLGDKKAKLLRGGSWCNQPDDVRSSFRDWVGPDDRVSSFGFRVVVSRTQ